jgi:carbon monoxide dehydrogenase subunit G
MVGVTVETDISSDVSTVFEYLAHIENQATWMPMIDSVELAGGTPQQAGASYTQVSKAMGATMEGVLEVLEAEPNTKLHTAAKSGPMKIDTVYELTEREGETHLKLTVDPGGAGAMMGPMIRKQLKEALRKLKAELEP